MDINIPIELDVTPELEAKIAENKFDAFATIQLIRAEDPNVLAKWETCLASSSRAESGDNGRAQ